MVYTHYSLQISSLIDTKPKGTQNYRTPTKSLFYISQKNIAVTNFTHFYKMYYNTLFEEPKESGAGVDPKRQVRASAMLV
jgi:hypothetical protein